MRGLAGGEWRRRREVRTADGVIREVFRRLGMEGVEGEEQMVEQWV